jgi:hypothetical protein
MIESSVAEVWRCSECGWVWFKKAGKIAKRCPNPKCRKLANYVTVTPKELAQVTGHDAATCRVWGCLMCKALKEHS